MLLLFVELLPVTCSLLVMLVFEAQASDWGGLGQSADGAAPKHEHEQLGKCPPSGAHLHGPWGTPSRIC